MSSSRFAMVAFAATSLLFAIRLAAQDRPAACDRTAIDWVLPGEFDQAIARTRQEQRILVIKGISFGVDTAGARCATKGVW